MKAKDLEQIIPETDSDQPTIKNVEAAFGRISQKGDYFWVNTDEKMPRWLYTQSSQYNNSGYQNHFQGIQRLQNRNFLVVSGGDWRNSKSDLFIIKMASRPETGPWWSNITTEEDAPEEDKVLVAIELDEKQWHGGGMDIQGNILAVPLEYPTPESIPKLLGFIAPEHGSEMSSKVIFFDLFDPEQPKKFPFEVKRKKALAGSTALTRLKNGYFLLAVWTYSDKKGKRLDFYPSNTNKFKDGFRAKAWTWLKDDAFSVGEQDRKFRDYQSINFVLQDDGTLYLIGLHNMADLAPIQGGGDFADLYLVELADGVLLPNPIINPNDTPRITKVADLRFECKNRQCNFDAGAGVYINNGELFVYSTYHFRGLKGIIKFNEYLPPYWGARGELTNENAWIEMFQESHFAGRRLAIRGMENMTYPNFDHVKAQKKGFEDDAFSIRYQLPKSVKCLLYKNKNFKKKLTLELTGTDKVVELPKLSAEIKGKISSMKLEP